MGDNSRQALARISKIRGCTLDQGKQYCARIRELQEGKKSSWFDISQALLWLDRQGRSYSDRHVATKAKTITTGSDPSETNDNSEQPRSEIGIVVKESGIRKFEGPEQHPAFLNWIGRYTSRG